MVEPNSGTIFRERRAIEKRDGETLADDLDWVIDSDPEMLEVLLSGVEMSALLEVWPEAREEMEKGAIQSRGKTDAA